MKRAYNGFDMSFNARIRGGVRAFGGFSIERTINDVCVSAASDPNRSLYCNQADSGIPWQKQFKATIVYPLPWYGISVSARSAEPERLSRGHRGAGLRRLHGRHRLRQSERPRHLLPGVADHALCGRTARARARPARWCCRRWPPAAWPRSASRSWLRKRSSRRASTSSISRSASRSSSARFA